MNDLTHYEHSALMKAREERQKHVATLQYFENMCKLVCESIAKHVVHIDSILSSVDYFAQNHARYMSMSHDESTHVEYDDAFNAFARASMTLIEAIALEDVRARREFVTRQNALTDAKMLQIAHERAERIADDNDMTRLLTSR